MLVFSGDNRYSVVVISATLSCLTIDNNLFKKSYKRILPDMAMFFEDRHNLIVDIMSKKYKFTKIIKKNFASTVEKGKLGVY